MVITVSPFQRDGAGALTAVQQLWSWLPADETTEPVDAYTSYSVPLEPTTNAPPAIT